MTETRLTAAPSMDDLWDELFVAVRHTDSGPRMIAARQAIEQAAVRPWREALGNLIKKLDHVHDSEAYLAHWMAGHVHIGPYQGPTYKDELEAARALLAGEGTK